MYFIVLRNNITFVKRVWRNYTVYSSITIFILQNFYCFTWNYKNNTKLKFADESKYQSILLLQWNTRKKLFTFIFRLNAHSNICMPIVRFSYKLFLISLQVLRNKSVFLKREWNFCSVNYYHFFLFRIKCFNKVRIWQKCICCS